MADTTVTASEAATAAEAVSVVTNGVEYLPIVAEAAAATEAVPSAQWYLAAEAGTAAEALVPGLGFAVAEAGTAAESAVKLAAWNRTVTEPVTAVESIQSDPDPDAAIVVSASLWARDLLEVTYAPAMRNDAALILATNYTIAGETGDNAVGVLTVTAGTEPSASSVWLHLTGEPSDGALYTVTVSTSGPIATGRGYVAAGSETAQFYGRRTKADELRASMPRALSLFPGDPLRAFVDAAGRQLDLMFGARRDRLP